MRAAIPTFFAAFLVVLPTASATPGPDTTVVIGNANVPESVALAERYAAARDLPAGQVCLLDVPDVEDIDLADYETMFLEPLRACLDRAPGTLDRIEAALLIRGVPLRVRIPDGMRTRVVSLAAALWLWNSNRLGVPLLGANPGAPVACGGGSTCFAAQWRNPYRGFPFEPGWALERDGVDWRPILVTMLHGRSYADAEGLLDSALTAEAMDPPTGEMLFMEGRDGARGVLDSQIDVNIAELEARGFTATRVPFDADLTGRTLSSFITGTATLGMTIEGNTFLPGTLVDNLTSFGAVPANFRDPMEEMQVSIARWVSMGVAGVHGTVAEPLNGVFPNRRFLVEYVDGATLAESYFALLPNTYWRNLVLGDPMAAPYAVRPELTVTGVADGAMIGDAALVSVLATDARGRGIHSLVAYLDGIEVARTDGEDTLELCLAAEAGDHELLIVGRAGADDDFIWMPKGWVSLSFSASGGSSECPMTDAGIGPDASVSSDGGGATDAGAMTPPSDGCACSAGRGQRPAPIALLATLALFVLRRRR